MKKSRFIVMLAVMAVYAVLSPLGAKESRDAKYSVVMLGDTHFDTEPASVYHSNYNEPVEWLNRVQRAEFARNGEMWRERCPRLLKRAAKLVTPDTRMALQMGDLIQGDCGNGEVHRKMLDDVLNNFKAALGGLPLVTVVGNHDIRGVDAYDVYEEYMPQRMSQELNRTIDNTTFAFTIGPDAFIVINFNDPEDDVIEKLLDETKDARYTFIITHGPVLPFDDSSCRWFLYGGRDQTLERLHFRKLFARRNAIVLCGHVHSTEFADWWGDGGRITQMTMNSVWAKDKQGQYEVVAQGAAQYGERRKTIKAADNGSKLKDETPLFDEYRAGLREYSQSFAAGSYKLNVSDKKVTIDFYAGDSKTVTKTFVLRSK
ncbi:MAG: metallophosphoesterase [Bacteroidales bacterium]|nr:metallophosphoesterase [Candidatus Sodaliphilus aphodohippi]